MSSGFAACPQCSSRMVVESLACWRCGTQVRGRLIVPLLARLPSEQVDFVIRFLQANGSLSQVQTDLACSYPKVRRLLNDVMASLKAEIEADRAEKDEILRALEEDKLDSTEALKLMRALAAGSPS